MVGANTEKSCKFYLQKCSRVIERHYLGVCCTHRQGGCVHKIEFVLLSSSCEWFISYWQMASSNDDNNFAILVRLHGWLLPRTAPFPISRVSAKRLLQIYRVSTARRRRHHLDGFDRVWGDPVTFGHLVVESHCTRNWLRPLAGPVNILLSSRIDYAKEHHIVWPLCTDRSFRMTLRKFIYQFISSGQ